MKLTAALLLIISPFVTAAAGLERDPAAADYSDIALVESFARSSGVRKPSHGNVNRMMMPVDEDGGLPTDARRKLQAELVFTGNGTELLEMCEANSTLNCCNGEDACDFDIDIEIFIEDLASGWNVCNGKRACQGVSSSSSSSSTGLIAQGSCNGDFSCRNAFVNLIFQSCIGKNACLNYSGSSVGVESCNGRGACKDASSIVRSRSCNGQEACQSSSGLIFFGSCNAKGACKNNRVFIFGGSCNALRACKDNNANIGRRACNGKESCLGNVNTVNSNTCNMDFECQGTNVP